MKNLDTMLPNSVETTFWYFFIFSGLKPLYIKGKQGFIQVSTYAIIQIEILLYFLFFLIPSSSHPFNFRAFNAFQVIENFTVYCYCGWILCEC